MHILDGEIGSRKCSEKNVKFAGHAYGKASFRETDTMYGRSGRRLLKRHIDLFLARFLKSGQKNIKETSGNLPEYVISNSPYVTVYYGAGSLWNRYLH